MLSLSFAGILFSTAGASADALATRNDETPASEWIEGVYNLTFSGPTSLNVALKFFVHEIVTGSGNYTAQDLRTITGGVAGNLTSEVETRISLVLSDVLGRLFKDASIKSSVETQIDFNTLDPAYTLNSSDPYQPPVMVYQKYNINMELGSGAYFTSAQLQRYSIPDLEDLLDGCLAMGARLSGNLTVSAMAGHSNTIRLLVSPPASDEDPDALAINARYPGSANYPQTFSISAKERTTSESGTQYFTMASRWPNSMTKESAALELQVDLEAFDAAYIRESTVSISSLRLPALLLPESIYITTPISSDGLRLLYIHKIITSEDITDILQDDIVNLELEFERLFNTTEPVDLLFSLDSDHIYNMTPPYYLEDTITDLRMGSDRPVIGSIVSTKRIAPHYFGDISNDATRGFLNAGAVGKMNTAIHTSFDYNMNLTLPPKMLLRGHSTTSDIGDRRSYTLQGNVVFIASASPPIYDRGDAEATVNIDLPSLEVNSLTSYTADLLIDINGVLHRIILTDALESIVPENITFEYMNADALRLAYREGILDLSDITRDLKFYLEENLTDLVGEPVEADITFHESTLHFDGDVENMDDKEPIEFDIIAEGKFDVGSSDLGGFIQRSITFSFPGFEGWDLEYLVELPPYIYIVDNPKLYGADSLNASVTKGVSSGGRHYLSVTIPSIEKDSEETKVETKVVLDISIWFVLTKTWIAVSLIIATLCAALFFRLKRKKLEKESVKKRGAPISRREPRETMAEPMGYEVGSDLDDVFDDFEMDDEDYYDSKIDELRPRGRGRKERTRPVRKGQRRHTSDRNRRRRSVERQDDELIDWDEE